MSPPFLCLGLIFKPPHDKGLQMGVYSNSSVELQAPQWTHSPACVSMETQWVHAPLHLLSLTSIRAEGQCVCIFLHPSSVYSYHMVCYRWAWVFDPNFPSTFLTSRVLINLLLPKKQHSLKHNASTSLHIFCHLQYISLQLCMYVFVCLDWFFAHQKL